MVARILERCRHADDAGDIFGAGSLAALLRAAFNDIGEDNPAPGIQCAHALGSVELVTRHREHIDVHRVYIDSNMPCRLHRVGVEQDACRMADCADLRDGLDGADFVVGKHDRNQTRIFADGVFDLLRGDKTVFMHVQQRHFEALFFQLRKRMQHRVMLKFGRNDVLFSFFRAEQRCRADCLVVCLAAAGGEGDFSGLRADARCDGGSCRLQALFCLLADGVQARRVSEMLRHIRKHRFQRGAAHFGRRGIVCVNLHHRIDSFRVGSFL